MTENWKQWLRFKVTDESLKTNCSCTLPIFNPYAKEWTIFHPYSTICEIVSDDEYMVERQKMLSEQYK